MVEAEREDDRGDEDGAGDGDAVPQHGLLGRLPLQPGRGGQQSGDGAEERADHDERQKDLHHGLVDIDHACSRSRGDEQGGDRQDDGAGEQRAQIGLDVAGLGAPHGGAQPAGQGARAAYVGVDDLAVEEPDEARGRLDGAYEQPR